MCGTWGEECLDPRNVSSRHTPARIRWRGIIDRLPGSTHVKLLCTQGCERRNFMCLHVYLSHATDPSWGAQIASRWVALCGFNDPLFFRMETSSLIHKETAIQLGATTVWGEPHVDMPNSDSVFLICPVAGFQFEANAAKGEKKSHQQRKVKSEQEESNDSWSSPSTNWVP